MISLVDRRNVLVGALALTSSGCSVGWAGRSGKPLHERIAPDRSVIFGFLRVRKPKIKVANVVIQQMAPSVKESYHYCQYQDGLVYLANVPLGSFQLTKITGSDSHRIGVCWLSCVCTGRNGRAYVLDLADYARNVTALRVERPGVHYFGAFEAMRISRREFELSPMQGHSRADVLPQLLPLAAGTQWESVVRDEIARR